jgi:hypothetical protein
MTVGDCRLSTVRNSRKEEVHPVLEGDTFTYSAEGNYHLDLQDIREASRRVDLN